MAVTEYRDDGAFVERTITPRHFDCSGAATERRNLVLATV